ncbi:MAG: hypothetical protein IKS63_03970 [Firmicutes bacterium]|nr:hypothetical protein [Bacillota bacterium]
MEKTMKSTAGRIAVIIVAIVMAIAFMPALAFEAHAGGGYDLPQPSGLNSGGTVDPETTLTVSANDIEAAQSGFKQGYKDGYLSVYWGIANNSSWAGQKTVKGTYSDGVFSLKVPIKYAGKWITFYVDGEDEYGVNFNANTAPVKVYDKLTVDSDPSFSTTYYSTGGKPLKKTFTFNVYGGFTYHWYDSYPSHTINKKIIRLYRNGKKIRQKTTSKDEVTFKNVPVSYSKKDKFKAGVFVKIGTKTIGGPSITFKEKSVQVGKNTVYATKLSKNKVIVRWSGATYANKYKIYKGKKLIKTVKSSKRKYIVKKKGAGKAKYKVIPIYKSGKKVCKGKSNRVKPKKNQVKFTRSTSYTAASYGTCPFVVTKISLKGSTYTVTGYALNNRIFDMTKYTKLKLRFTIGGKKAFSKTYKNKYIRVKESSSKKVVLKIKGKKGKDLANGGFCSITVEETPYWTWHGQHIQ